MKYDPQTHHRRSIRLKEYDYAKPGGYFITICIHDHAPILGSVVSDNDSLTDIGQIVKNEWLNLSTRFPFIDLDEFVVMPNHVHGIIIIKEDSNKKGEDELRPYGEQPKGTLDKSLGRIVQAFKSITTNQYWKMIKTAISSDHQRQFWQRNYYEHVIRDERDLMQIREYIRNNPLQWALDKENPDNIKETSYSGRTATRPNKD